MRAIVSSQNIFYFISTGLFEYIFLLDKCDMEPCVYLRRTSYKFDSFIYFTLVATEVIFIILHTYGVMSFSIYDTLNLKQNMFETKLFHIPSGLNSQGNFSLKIFL